MAWTGQEYLVWPVSTEGILLREALPFSNMPNRYRYVSASPRSDLLVRLSGPEITDIAFSHGWDVFRGRALSSVSTYANAKVLLLGDSGVGERLIWGITGRKPVPSGLGQALQ